MTVRKAVRRVVITVVGVLTILVLAEIALRVAFPGLKRVRLAYPTLAYQYDRDCIVSLKPNMEKQYEIKRGEPNAGEVIDWKTNSLGFRGDEIGEETGLRVIVYGDSNIQARFSRLEDTYPFVLQQLLRPHFEHAQVINAGIVGSGPDECLIRLTRDFDTVQPDIVVFHVFADNDYGDLLRDRLFELAPDGTLVKTSFPVTVDERLTSFHKTLSRWSHLFYLEAVGKALVGKIRDYRRDRVGHEEWAKEVLGALEQRAASTYEIYRAGKPRQISHFEDYYDIDVAAHPDSESAQVKIALMDAVLAAASKACAERGVTFLVLVQPGVFDLSKNVNLDVGHLDLERTYPDYRPENLTDPLREICAKHALNCVHLIDAYRQNDPATVYRHDGHWNTKGQRIAAEETAKKILELRGP